jgi:peptidoglycan/xylan/chitin deacetylase (PgdA/CDA1 family)
MGTIGSLTVAGCTGRIGAVGEPGAAEETGTEAPTDRPTEEPTATPTATDTATGTPSDGGVGERIDAFEDMENWYVLQEQGTLTAETQDAYEGSQSAHVESATGDVYGAIFKAFDEPVDFSDRNVSMAVKLEEPEIAKITVDLLAPDRGNMVRMTRTLTGPTDRWMRVDFGVTDVRRDPELSEVREIRIVGRRRGGVEKPVEFAVDDLRAVEAPTKGRVMLTFDDSHDSHYEKAFETMQEYGFPGVEGVIAESIYGNNQLDVGMMREMSDAGWDMASHPLTRGTQLQEFSAAEQRKRIEENKQFLVRKGFEEGARHFLTPQNMRGPKTFDLVREHHETMFSFGGMPNGLPSTTTYNYGRVNASDAGATKRLVDNAAKFGQLLVVNHHRIGQDGLPLSEFRSVLDHIEKADVEVVTASDLLDSELTSRQG